MHIRQIMYSKTSVKMPNIGFQDQLLLNAGQKNCRMLQGELPFGELPFVIKIFVLSFLSGFLHRFYCINYMLATNS